MSPNLVPHALQHAEAKVGAAIIGIVGRDSSGYTAQVADTCRYCANSQPGPCVTPHIRGISSRILASPGFTSATEAKQHQMGEHEVRSESFGSQFADLPRTSSPMQPGRAPWS